MGGQPSRTRRLTLENDDPTSVIKVSDEVVQRIKGQEGKGVRQAMNPAVPWPPMPQGVPVGVPYPFFEPSLSSIQLRQEKDDALKSNDKYWENRIVELEKNHEKMHEVMQCEYKKAVQEGIVKKYNDDPTPPCLTSRKAVLACYKKYPNEPMRCAKEVQAFTECVDLKRATVIANKG